MPEVAAPADGSVASRILDAALTLYLERGMRDTSLSAVAARAGVSRPTVYKHVGDVATVATMVVDRELDRFFGALADQLAAPLPAVDRLSGAIGFAVAHARRHPLLQRLLQLEPDAILPVFTVAAAPVLRRAVGVLAPVLDAAASDARQPPRDRTIDAELLARLTISLVITPPLARDLSDAATLRRLVTTLLANPDTAAVAAPAVAPPAVSATPSTTT
jgi:AcrR family transcriptional regulator